MAGKQVIKNIFLIFLLVTMGSIISVNLIHSIARRQHWGSSPRKSDICWVI